jgi:hypothetical protein
MEGLIFLLITFFIVIVLITIFKSSKKGFNNSELKIEGDKLAKQIKDNFNKYMKLPLYLDNLSLYLIDEEYPIIATWTDLFEERAYRNFYGASVRVAKGINIFGGQSISKTNLTKIDNGEIFITNRRVVFLGKKRTVETALDKIIGVDVFQNGITIHKSNKSKAEVYMSPSVNLISTVLDILLKFEFVLDDDGKTLIELNHLSHCNYVADDFMKRITSLSKKEGEKFPEYIKMFEELSLKVEKDNLYSDRIIKLLNSLNKHK